MTPIRTNTLLNQLRPAPVQDQLAYNPWKFSSFFKIWFIAGSLSHAAVPLIRLYELHSCQATPEVAQRWGLPHDGTCAGSNSLGEGGQVQLFDSLVVHFARHVDAARPASRRIKRAIADRFLLVQEVVLGTCDETGFLHASDCEEGHRGREVRVGRDCYLVSALQSNLANRDKSAS